MTTRPILMSAPMVQAILDGRKTQTRRILKPQPELQGGCYFLDDGTGWETQDQSKWPCPHGAPGDTVYVRETWAETESDGGPVIAYRAGGYLMHGGTGERRQGTWKDETFPGDAGQVYPPEAWHPSIHMPRWASRITLEIVSVRVERVAEISEDDAVAEGLEPDPIMPESHWLTYDGSASTRTPEYAFQTLWDSLNAKRGFGWEANPFVWVIEFKREIRYAPQH